MTGPRTATSQTDDLHPMVIEIGPEICAMLRDGFTKESALSLRSSGIGLRLDAVPETVREATVEAIRTQRCVALTPDGPSGTLWTVVPVGDGRLIVTRLPPATLPVQDDASAKIDALREARESMFHAFGAPAIILGPDRQVRAVNEAAQALLVGNQSVGSDLARTLRSGGIEPPMGLQDALDAAYIGERRELPARTRSRDFVRLTLVPVQARGQVRGVCVTVLPAAAERATGRSGLYERVVESTGQAFFSWQVESDQTEWAGAVPRLLERSARGLNGPLAKFLALVAPDEARALELELRAISTSGHTLARELRLPRGDGTVRVLQCAVALGTSVGNVGTTLVGLLSDVTDLAAMRQNTLEAQKHEALGRLAGGVAHDFNNMLTVVQYCANAIEGHIPPDSPAREEVREIKLAADRAAGLIQQMLSFARRQRVTPSFHPVAEVIERLMPMLRRLLPDWIELNTVIEPSTPSVVVDLRQIEQAVVNLVVNARDAMKSPGVVTVRTRGVVERDAQGDRKGWAEISVQDQGEGMRPDVLARVFEPYFTTKPIGHGTGLGLATVYGIVRAAAGEVRVESELGRGSTFSLRLPSAAQIAAAAQGLRSLPSSPPPALTPVAPVAPTSSVAPAPISGMKDLSVMVVEDEPAVRRAVLSALRCAGIRAVDADGLTQALARCPPKLDLLITDVRMPEAPGPEVARRIVERHPNARVLYMSGYTGEDHREEDLSPMLRKPFSLSDLNAALKSVLEDIL